MKFSSRHRICQYTAFIFLACCHILLIPEGTFSQNPPDSVQTPENEGLAIENAAERIERMAERTETDADYSALLDDLTSLQENPANLNALNLEALCQADLLDELQANHLREYILTYGAIRSVYELMLVPGFDSSVVNRILPYVTTGPPIQDNPADLRKLLHFGRQQVLLRFQQVVEKAAGYRGPGKEGEETQPAYPGSPLKIWLRYSYNYRDIVSAGITCEKDPGEEFFRGPQKNGFDFYSGYLSIRNKGLVRNLIIGDYHAQFGQGLTLWSGSGYGPATDGTSPDRNGRGLRPSASANENGFLRGIAVETGKGKAGFTAFFSHQWIDGNLTAPDTTQGASGFITALQETGYHRTAAELDDKDAVLITLAGGRFSFHDQRLRAGITGYRMHLSKTLEYAPADYRSWKFSGAANTVLGMDASYLLHMAVLYGEVSRSSNGGLAWLTGVRLNMGPRADFNLLWHSNPEKYQNLFSGAYGMGLNSSGENGILLGGVFRLHSRWTCTASRDLTRFPWFRYRTNGPSVRDESTLNIQYDLSRRVQVNLQYRRISKAQNSDRPSEGINFPATGVKESYRCQVSYELLPGVKLKNRLEYARTHEESGSVHTGLLLYQDIQLKFPGKTCSFTGRMAVFDADTWDDRIYAYENDVLYGCSSPAYNGKGMRFYLLSCWKVSRRAEVWLRYARTVYQNQTSIGSGNDEIGGNHKTEVKLQLRLHF